MNLTSLVGFLVLPPQNDVSRKFGKRSLPSSLVRTQSYGGYFQTLRHKMTEGAWQRASESFPDSSTVQNFHSPRERERGHWCPFANSKPSEENCQGAARARASQRHLWALACQSLVFALCCLPVSLGQPWGSSCVVGDWSGSLKTEVPGRIGPAMFYIGAAGLLDEYKVIP